MEHYVGLDVSLKLTAICIVDRTGKIEREGMVASDPETIAAFIKSHATHVARVGLEIDDDNVVRLGPKDSAAFLKALDEAPEPNEKLKELMHSPGFGSEDGSLASKAGSPSRPQAVARVRVDCNFSQASATLNTSANPKARVARVSRWT
jgi:Protein of unknown function (DUF1778)